MNELQLLKPGTILHSNQHDYHIISALGQGGFGITYLAETTINNQATIKIAIKEFFMKDLNGRKDNTVTTVQEEGIYKKYYKKFETEATNLSALTHPQIVRIIELFKANNTLYYVMTYIEGSSLEKYITEKGFLQEDEALASLRQIAEAVGHMHKKHILHLDLKPGNIMRKTDGGLVLIDFGLSKYYDENNAPESSTTIGAGTPGYAPLEQTDYHGGRDFPTTLDIYAMGATLFKMLTGKTPPVASEVMNEGLPEEELRRNGVSERTIYIIKKAMMPMKHERFQTIKEMMAAFNRPIPSSTVTSVPEVADATVTMRTLTTKKNNVLKQQKGTFELPQGQYKGLMKNNKPQGYGTLQYHDGSVYEGVFSNGRRHGHGMLTFPNQSKYIGEFLNDQITGQGLYYDADGNIQGEEKKFMTKTWLKKGAYLFGGIGMILAGIASIIFMYHYYIEGGRIFSIKILIAPLFVFGFAIFLLDKYSNYEE